MIMGKPFHHLRRAFYALALVAIAVGGWYVPPVIAQNAGQFVTSLLANDAIQIYRQGTAANVYSTPVTLSSYVRAQSLLYSTVATAATTATTVEQTLGTYSLPANYCNSGTTFTVRYSFTTGANSNNKTMRLYFGSTVNTTGAQAANAQNGLMAFTVVCQGGAHQIVQGSASIGTNVTIAPFVSYGTNVVTAPIVIKATGQNGSSSAADIILNYFSVERSGS